MGTHRRVISDSHLAPTHADEVTNVTRMELSRALRSLDVTAAEATLHDDDVFSEDTIEAAFGLSDEATLV